jgi:hypothetical protein
MTVNKFLDIIALVPSPMINSDAVEFLGFHSAGMEPTNEINT